MIKYSFQKSHPKLHSPKLNTRVFFSIILTLGLFTGTITFANTSVNSPADKSAGKNYEIPKTSKNKLAEEVAKAYGIENWHKVKSVSFTFNVRINGKKAVRKWQWKPKTNEVTYWGKDKDGQKITYTYNRSKMDSAKKTLFVDARFINDQYWLLFPFHLVWDDNVKITDTGIKNYPITSGKGVCLDVHYENNVGYTPGDEFKLYLGKDNMIKEWQYLPGGNSKKARPATWEDNKNFGGIIISTQHSDNSDKFRLWFTDIKFEFE